MDAAFKQGPGRVHRGGWRPQSPRICRPDLQPIADGSLCLVLYGSCVWEGKRPGTLGLEPQRARTRHARLQGLGSQTLVSRKLLASDKGVHHHYQSPSGPRGHQMSDTYELSDSFLGRRESHCIRHTHGY